MCEVSYDGETVDGWSQKQVKARRWHYCASCHGVIAAGDLYLRHFYVEDRMPFAEKQCLPCAKISGAYTEAHRVEWTPCALRDALESCVDGEPEGSEISVRWVQLLAEMNARRTARNAWATQETT